MPSSRPSPLRVQPSRSKPSRLPSPKKPTYTRPSPRVATENGLAALKKDLSRYTRVNDRIMVVRCLQNCMLLNCLPLDASPLSPTSPEHWKKLENEVCSTSLILNGHNFEVHKYANIHTMKVLIELCRQLCQDITMEPQSLYHALIVRLAKTTSSADCYFHLTAALGSSDLIIQTPSKPFNVPPSELTIYQVDGYVHATLSVYHPFGLFRKSDLTSGGKPWVKVIAAAHERVNLTTGMSTRHVNLKVHEGY